MAHLWVRDGLGVRDELGMKDETEWRTWPLEHGAVRISGCGPTPSPTLPEKDTEVVLVCPGIDGRWVLLAGAATRVRVNGLPTAGIRVLKDRDEIRVWAHGDHIVFFSTEQTASILPYAGPEGAACPRCRQVFELGVPAVECPHCGVWHHETEQSPCWTYTTACAVCSKETCLDAGYDWRPEVPCVQ